jgi:hypothetical protein
MERVERVRYMEEHPSRKFTGQMRRTRMMRKTNRGPLLGLQRRRV